MSLESMRAKDGRMDEGEPVASVARHVGVSRPTAGKYARMAGLSPEPPRMRQPQSEGAHSPLSLTASRQGVCTSTCAGSSSLNGRGAQTRPGPRCSKPWR